MTETLNLKQTPPLHKTSVRCRFFAQYWGTKTLYVGGKGLQEIGNGGWNLKHPDFFLELKPLSKITKEDLQQMFIKEFPFDNIFNNYDFMCKYNFINYFIVSNVCKKAYLKIIDFENNKEFNSFHYKTISHIGIDFLRSKGYAVPFMEYSVEDLISFGWVRLV